MTRWRDIAFLVLGFAIGVAIVGVRAQKESDVFIKSFERGSFSLLAAGGQCEYGRSAEGMWHQQAEGRETSGNFRPRCGQLGFGYRPANSPWGINFTYFDGGKASLNALAIAYPDDDASKHDPSADLLRQQCRQAPSPDCLQRIRGSGGIQGFSLVATYDFLKVWKLVAEAGAGVSIYRASWDVRVLPVDPDCLGDDSKCGWQASINQRTGWLLSPNAQLKIKYEPFFVQVKREFRTVQHAPIAAGYDGSHRSILFGVEIPFWSL